MKIFEGKSPAERNKIIAAIVIGVLAVLAIGNLVFAPFSGKKTINVKLSPSPTATTSTKGDTVVTSMPKQDEMDQAYLATPVLMQSPPSASDAGRNIFAFYEPPVPTPFSPTPFVFKNTPTPPTPTPTPVPPVTISYISKQSAYAGEKGFKLEIGGDKFTPETFIFFGGNQLPTNYISPQQMTADIPSNFIAGAGQPLIEVRSADGKLFSNKINFSIQAPPVPQFQYIGIVSRKRGNNDTAYIQEQGKTVPTGVRLNDIINGRFRLVSISPAKLLVQDINLGFTHPIELVKGSGQSSSTTIRPNNPNFPNDGNNYIPYPNQQNIPGIPNSIPRYVQPTPQPQDKKDEDDDDGNN
ncbi:MAG: hypothetical protein ABJA66_04110 [Actinomycetota bacterium]